MERFGSLFGSPSAVSAEDGYGRYLNQLVQSAHAFWAAWQKEEARLATLDNRGFVEQGNAILKRHCPEVGLELEGLDGNGGKPSLIFTAHGMLEQFPQVQALVDTAQTQRYQVCAFRHGSMASPLAWMASRFLLPMSWPLAPRGAKWWRCQWPLCVIFLLISMSTRVT